MAGEMSTVTDKMNSIADGGYLLDQGPEKYFVEPENHKDMAGVK